MYTTYILPRQTLACLDAGALTITRRKPTSHVLASASGPALPAATVVAVVADTVLHQPTTTTIVAEAHLAGTAHAVTTTVAAPHPLVEDTTRTHATTVTARLVVGVLRWTTTHLQHAAATPMTATLLHHHLVAPTQMSRT